MREETMKNGRTLLKYILYAVVLAVLAEFMMTLDYHSLLGAHGNSNQQLTLSMKDAELVNCEIKDGKVTAAGENPQLIFKDINQSVSSFQLGLKSLSSSVLDVRVYYAASGEEFSEEKSVEFSYYENQRFVTSAINGEVESLRVDIGDQEGDSYVFDELCLNPHTLTYLKHSFANLSGLRIFLYFIGIFLLFLAAQDFGRFCEMAFRYRWVIGAIVIAFCTILKLHGSSIGVLGELLTGRDVSRVWGTSRSIRTDEYVVFTEMALSQVKSGFHWFSDVWGYTPSDMFIVYGQPVLNLTTLFRPFSVGYILFGAERGLAFYWSSRLVICFLVSFEFGRIFTKDKRMLSTVYAFMISFAPVVQWWFSINELVEMLIFGQLALIILYYYVRTDSLKRKCIMVVGLVICAGGYIMTLYPAWMIPLFFVFLACALAMILEDRKRIHIKKQDVLLWGAGILVLAVSMVYIFSTSMDTITAEMNTVYPGARTYAGSMGDFDRLFKSWSSWLWSFGDTGNPCEESDFISLFPLGMVLSLIALVKSKKKDLWLIVLNVFNAFLILFFLFRMPDLIIKLSLLGHASYRLYNAIGFLNIILLLRSLAASEKTAANFKLFLPVAIVTAIMSYWGNTASITPAFKVIILISVIGVTLLLLHFEKKEYQMAFAVLMISVNLVGGGLVNPVCSGLDNVYKLPVVQQIEKLSSQEEGMWVVTGDAFMYENLPTVVGAKTLNAVATYPDEKLWEDLGLSDQDQYWNRYAHVSVEIGDETKVGLGAADVLKVEVTAEKLKELGVTYVLSLQDMEDTTGLEQVGEANNFTIYKIA